MISKIDEEEKYLKIPKCSISSTKNQNPQLLKKLTQIPQFLHKKPKNHNFTQYSKFHFSSKTCLFVNFK